MKEELKSHWQTWIFFVTLGVILIIIYKAIDSIGYIGSFIQNFISIISPFLVGLLIAYLLYIPEKQIEQMYKRQKAPIIRRKARTWAILTTYVIVILLIIIIVNFILPVLLESVNELISNVQNYYSTIIELYNNLPEDSIFKTEQVYEAIKELQNFDLKQYLSMDRLTEYIKGAVGLAIGIFDVFVAFVVSIYILSQRNEILKFFKKLIRAIFKEDTCYNIEKYFYRANNVFFKFISGQLIDAIIVGILTTIVLNIMQIKYASLLGLTIGLFNMIPYFGAIVAVIIAGIVTIITAGFSKAILMLVIIIILQQIDANIINPKIVGDSVDISPLLVIFAVTIGGAYFGVIGMFLGVPVVAIIKIMVNDYIDKRLSM